MEALPEWILTRYHALREAFGNGPFTRSDAERILKQEGKDLANMNEFFAVLMREGLIRKEGEKKGTRYFIVGEKEPSGRIRRDDITRILKQGADIIRNRDYRMLLILLFYKALSDKWEKRVEMYKAEGMDEEEAMILANRDYYFLYDEDENIVYTWKRIVQEETHLAAAFEKAFRRIAEMNPKLEKLPSLVDKVGLSMMMTHADSRRLFQTLIATFTTLDLKDVEEDVIGDGYEWILSYFAPDKAKAGEIYTPREVVKLMTHLLDVQPGSSVLDPAAGSCSMLIHAHHYVKETYGGDKTVQLEGQEWEDTTVVLGEMNLVLHGVTEDFTLYHGDSLRNPQFGRADYALANPPWNLDYELPEEEVERNVYAFGIPSKKSADWLWVQLLHAFSKEKAAVILDTGALFRGGREQKIRKAMLEAGVIDTIILLPEKLFYNTQAAGIIMILRGKGTEKPGEDVLIINAGGLYEKHPSVRKLNRLGEAHIRKIVALYRERKEEEGVSRRVSLDEIRENDYSLNVTLYVHEEEEEEDIDVREEWKQYEQEKKKLEEIEKKIRDYVGEVYGQWS